MAPGCPPEGAAARVSSRQAAAGGRVPLRTRAGRDLAPLAGGAVRHPLPRGSRSPALPGLVLQPPRALISAPLHRAARAACGSGSAADGGAGTVVESGGGVKRVTGQAAEIMRGVTGSGAGGAGRGALVTWGFRGHS